MKQPPILDFYELSAESLYFLESLKSVSKPRVETSPLPGLSRKLCDKVALTFRGILSTCLLLVESFSLLFM